jgi:hypothetical protein
MLVSVNFDDALNVLLCKQSLEERFESLKADMFVQTTNVGKLAHIQLKDRERDQQLSQEREQLIKSTMDKLKGQHADFLQAVTNFGKDIDEKMKDIRSLLLGMGGQFCDTYGIILGDIPVPGTVQ